ncbi:MAG: aldose 1-epimerase family protein [Oscillibacter sp.]|nr:aldose 1-epimerase family protein [Oscillibacter sp.]
MIVTLKNEQLTVEIEDVGAQLASITAKDGTQYLWQGDPDIWPRRAPLLFPVLGRLKGGQYTLGEETYTIPTHGFCRDALFAVEQHSDTSVSFHLTDSEDTRAVYPFAFALTVTYTLEGNRLVKAHKVENRSQQEMYYEVGGHDGFRAPLAEGEKMDDYAIHIPGLEAIQPYAMNEELMLIPKNVIVPLHNGRISLKPYTYGQDTVILDQIPQSKAILVDGQDRPRVTLEFADFPYLGIWTQNKDYDTNYVCIEPWTTLPDGTFVGRGLKDKAGIRTLAPGQSETVTYTTIFE